MTQLHEEQVEEHTGRQAEFGEFASAQDENARGHLECRKHQREEGDVGHDHGGPQLTEPGDESRFAKCFVDVIVKPYADHAANQIPQSRPKTGTAQVASCASEGFCGYFFGALRWPATASRCSVRAAATSLRLLPTEVSDVVLVLSCPPYLFADCLTYSFSRLIFP